ncbi:MAG: CapA family protein [Lachnospiraceae bacterium]|nr:CapA family protein [Lachnospiraceae bacterium]
MRKKDRYLYLTTLLLALGVTGCMRMPGEDSAQVFMSESVEETNSEVLIEQLDVPMTMTTEVETQQDEIETVEEPEPQEVSLVMVGDILMHTKVYESGLMEDGSYNYDHMFAQVKTDIEEADIAIVNQEVILGGRELGLSGYPAFNAAFEVGDSLVDAGFDVILHATNHALDKGKKGLLNCIQFWEEQYPDIAVLGIHESEEDAQEIYVQEINGIRVAILNYTYGTNGIALPKDMPYAVELWDEKQIADDVVRAKEIADFIVVCPHWGTEYVLEETADQRKKAQFLADLGVDLVIGTHPHVVEPVKWVSGAEGNQMLVYYSIGNFINATSGTGNGKAARMLGAMAEVTIAMNEETQEAYISEYGIEPLVTHNVSGSGQITTYKLVDYTEELAKQNEMIYQDRTFSKAYCEDISSTVFGDLYIEQEEGTEEDDYSDGE